jgi:hypothetical protein
MSFLEMLFGQKEPDEGKILIWTLKDKASAWFDTAEAAAVYVEKRKNQDIYVGCGLSPEDFGRNKRCPASKVIGLPGFYADIDIADKVHKKQNLPATMDEAIDLLSGHGFDPTVIVDSGHGIHAWWLFNEIWDISDYEERSKAATLSRRLFHTLQNRFSVKGWDIDSVFDLARVLRIPGTMNRKSEPKMARTLVSNGNRYEPMDMEEFFDPEAAERPQGLFEERVDADFVINQNANPPLDKLEALRDVDPKFNKSWLGTRKDLASPSEFDLSLANYAVQAEWSDQEIVNLIIAFRRIRGHDMKKALRPDYLKSTIMKARAPVVERQQMAEANAKAKEEMAEAKGEGLAEIVSKHLGINILGVKKYMVEPPTYTIETESGAVDIGGAENIIEQRLFRKHIFATTDHLIRKFSNVKKKGITWDEIAQGLANLAEKIEVGPDGTDSGEVRSWFVDYLETVDLEKDINDAAITRSPVIHGGKVLIFLPRFMTWLAQRYGVKMTNKAVAAKLRKCGAAHKIIAVVVDGRNTTRSVWALPEEYGAYVG